MAYRTPKDLADRMAARRRQAKADDGFAREKFTLPREQAPEQARAFLDQWPAAAYIECGRILSRTARRQNRVYDADTAFSRLAYKVAFPKNGSQITQPRSGRVFFWSEPISLAYVVF